MLATVTIAGYLGADPDEQGEGSSRRARLSVATTDRTKVDGEWIDRTTWWSVTVWGRDVDFAVAYLARGSFVVVTGTVAAREYTDRDGNVRQSLDVNASRLAGPKAPAGHRSDRSDSRDDDRRRDSRPPPAPDRDRTPRGRDDDRGRGSGRKPPAPRGGTSAHPDDDRAPGRDDDLPF
jgi:single stranded DNA-binding protein